MKRRLNILVWAALTAGLTQSCFFSEDDLFDAPAEERDAQALTEYRNLLTEAPNGWLLEYYPGGESHDIGGVVLLMKFDGNNVTIASDTQVKGFNDDAAVIPGQKTSSLYALKNEQGTVLSFSTYNPLLHYWTEPKGGALSDGYKGDFEFIITGTDKDMISLRGKLYGTEMRMTRLPEGQDWDAYIAACRLVRSQSEEWGTLVGYRDGTEFTPSAFSQENVIRFEEQDNNAASTRKVSFTYTPDGIHLYAPTTVNGVTMDRLSWNNNEKAFSSTNDRNVSLKYVQPADWVPIEFYTDHSWALSYDFEFGQKDTTEYITFTRIEDTDTLRTQFSALGVKLNVKTLYNRTTGMLEFRMQYVDMLVLGIRDEEDSHKTTEVNTYIYLAPWNTEDFTMYYGEKSGIVSHTTQMEPRTLAFKDNGRSTGFEADGFIFYGFRNMDRSGMLGTLNSYSNITLTQQTEPETEQ